MPYWKCRKCHHEFEGRSTECDWCGCPEADMLEKATPLEKMLKSWNIKGTVTGRWSRTRGKDD